MRINSQNFNMNFGQMPVRNFQISPFKVKGNDGDIFVKNVQNTENIWQKSGEDILRQIYDKTFDEVTAEISICKELNIEKPALVLDDNPDYDDHASYTFYDNTMRFSSDFLREESYLLVKADKNGDIQDYWGIVGDEELKSPALRLKLRFRGLKPVKLSYDEKKTFIQGILAHELRHMVQEHLLASSKSCGENYHKMFTEPIDGLRKTLFELEKHGAKNLDTEKERLLETEAKCKYVLNFKPKKLIEDDLSLRFSLAADDNRYWSTKEHFFKNSIDGERESKAQYFASPFEIDANRFAAEFIILKNNMENGINKGIVSYFMNESEGGLLNLQKYGYPDLMTK